MKMNNSIPLNNSNIQNSKTINKKYIPKPYLEAAQGMEKQFIQLMVKEMKKTTQGPESTSTGMDYYMDLQSGERADAMVKKNQVGLQDLILDKIYPEKFRNVHAFNAYKQQTNQMNNRSNVEMRDAHVKEHNDIELHKVTTKNSVISNGQGLEASHD
ncbi:hypothetical protein A9Q84_20295 [Halobacteriovorax marinus]|uniref:Flagellar protein FlgJ N-terminal domain-containing protein n=1 Tax=Halobacteriovorax marinus TaxID=97084 RepID=A0A1Y5F1P9_9BACT|nr:hypothetical protein A9Q84_20295 [Halobacteriovorax marinus]